MTKSSEITREERLTTNQKKETNKQTNKERKKERKKDRDELHKHTRKSSERFNQQVPLVPSKQDIELVEHTPEERSAHRENL